MVSALRTALKLSLVSSLLLVGCGESAATPAEAPSAEPAPATEPAPAPEPNVPAAAGEGMATVAPGGSRFDPPIAATRVPEGAWFCDMGTVHYAAREAGACAVCGMTLVQRTAPGHGHDHADEGHGHDHGDDSHGDHGHAH